MELIIPRLPSPELEETSPLGVNPDISNAQETASQKIARLERELAAVKREAKIKVKVEGQDADGRKRSREGDEVPNSGRAYKVIKKRSGMIVVDLTED